MHNYDHTLQKDFEQRTLPTSQLLNIINQWSLHPPHPTKSSNYRFKFSLAKILPLPQKLLQDVLVYVILVKFPYILEDYKEDFRMQKSFELKKIYGQEFFKGRWKKQFTFQFVMVYLTKMMGSFIGEYFPSLDINEKLQSQIFIILNGVFIGNQIGTKLYFIIAKKYIKTLSSKSMSKKQNQIGSISLSVQKKDSIITAFKPSTKYISQVMHSQSYGGTKHRILYANNLVPSDKSSQQINPHNINFRRNLKAKISFLKNQKPLQKSNFELFNEQLKKSLYVDPLPVIQPKKIDITEYEAMRQQTKDGLRDYRSVEDRKRTNENFLKSYQLKSSKNTSSMEMLTACTDGKDSKHSFTKPSKILLSRQLNSKHYCLTSSSIHNDIDDKPLTQLFKKQAQQKNSSPKNTGRLVFQDQHYFGKNRKISSKMLNIYEKQNFNLIKSFDSKQGQGQSLHQYMYDKPSQAKHFQHPSEKINYDGLKTEQGDREKSLQRQSELIESQETSQRQQQRFSKLGSFTFTASNDQGAVVHSIDSLKKQKDPNLTKKNQPRKSYKKNFSKEKLSKMSKLKLAKLQFISQCKQRQIKICSTQYGVEQGYDPLSLVSLGKKGVY